MLTFVHRCITLLLFTAGLLAGLQLPGFATQYQQQVAARLAEAERSLSGFQQVADQYHGGEIAALVAHHRNSRDASFRAEAAIIYGIWKRVALLKTEAKALDRPLVGQLWHIATNANRETLRATAASYSPVAPLNSSAVIFGVIGGLLLVLLSEILFTLLSTFRSHSTNSHLASKQ